MLKKCEKCGYIHLSKSEKIVMDNLPGTAAEISAKTKMKKQSVFIFIERLKKYNLLYGIKENTSKIIWKKT